MIRAVLFDLDGTLVRTFIDFPALRQAMQDISRRYGTENATSQEEDTLGIVQTMTSALPAPLAEKAFSEASQRLIDLEKAGCEQPETIAGASELLLQLQRTGVRVGIITRNSRAIALDLLARQQLPYDLLMAREDTSTYKPHPDPLLIACGKLGVIPLDTVMVGDLWTDVAAGKAAGVRTTIGIQWAHDPPGRFARCQPDITVSSLAEVGDFLQRLLPEAIS